jgi:hypothetical protein
MVSCDCKFGKNLLFVGQCFGFTVLTLFSAFATAKECVGAKVPLEYAHISDAITAAGEKGTVCVSEGVYHLSNSSSFVSLPSVSIVGSGRGKTIIRHGTSVSRDQELTLTCQGTGCSIRFENLSFEPAVNIRGYLSPEWGQVGLRGVDLPRFSAQTDSVPPPKESRCGGSGRNSKIELSEVRTRQIHLTCVMGGVLIENSVIAPINSPQNAVSGFGITLSSSIPSLIRNNAIYGNQYGLRFQVLSGDDRFQSEHIIANNIFYGNKTAISGESTGEYYRKRALESFLASATLTHNLWFNNEASLVGVAFQHEGSAFKDPELDFTKSPPIPSMSSPLVGAADHRYISEHDYFGNLRGESLDVGPICVGC